MISSLVWPARLSKPSNHSACSLRRLLAVRSSWARCASSSIRAICVWLLLTNCFARLPASISSLWVCWIASYISSKSAGSGLFKVGHGRRGVGERDGKWLYL
uniref:(northern house mosquito) hypothetical protein n=1 Tax=Culex pipiens TaxID=7175 RepID=A0A8D8CCE0_CULPI